MKYWLLKSEPDCYSLDDLKRDRVESWDGVRNYQARNFMRDEMEVGDLAIFYHSSTKPPHAAGICKIVKAGYPDHTAFDPNSDHPDLESDPDNPRWFMVDVEYVEHFNQIVILEEMKKNEKLWNMKLLQRGNRLSVMPIEKAEFDEIVKMGIKK